jgi:hypothetical protein
MMDNVKDTGCDDADWIQPTQNRIQGLAVVNMAMDIQVP